MNYRWDSSSPRSASWLSRWGSAVRWSIAGIVELENRGFLDVRPRVGTFVADYRRAGTMETLKSIMTYNRGRLRNEEIRSILEVRDALDKLAVADIIPSCHRIG